MYSMIMYIIFMDFIFRTMNLASQHDQGKRMDEFWHCLDIVQKTTLCVKWTYRFQEGNNFEHGVEAC
jgi:hypothetical protein